MPSIVARPFSPFPVLCYYVSVAKIKAFPSMAIVGGFKGTLDFYYNMGIACVRTWPKSPGKRRSPAVMAQWDTWRYITKAWSKLSPEMQAVYYASASGTNLSGRDLFQKNFINSSSFVRL